MQNLLTNDLVYIYLISGIVCLTTAYFIKTKFFNSSIIETPPTFNFSQRELSDIQEFLNQGGVLNQETQDRLDQDLEKIMGQEDYANFTQEMQQIDNEMQNFLNNELPNILNNELLNIHCPLESTDLYFNTLILELIDIITNL